MAKDLWIAGMFLRWIITASYYIVLCSDTRIHCHHMGGSHVLWVKSQEPKPPAWILGLLGAPPSGSLRVTSNGQHIGHCHSPGEQHIILEILNRQVTVSQKLRLKFLIDHSFEKFLKGFKFTHNITCLTSWKKKLISLLSTSKNRK